MKIDGNAIRPGNILEYKGRLMRALKTQHVKPGKGGAYMQVELKDIRDGTKMNERFRSSESVERVRLDEKSFQYLYSDGDMVTFMDNENFDQISLPLDMVGEPADFLQESMNVKIAFYDDAPISVSLPDSVVMEITEADAVIKGQTASASFKPAVLENGRKIMVPPHIEAGTRVVVSTSDGNYVERAKGGA